MTPNALNHYRNFIIYRTERDSISGKLNKIPTVSVTDPTKWMSHEDACEFANQYPGKFGVGFVLTAEI
jgi:primase-polymerase (primpol)-like protein